MLLKSRPSPDIKVASPGEAVMTPDVFKARYMQVLGRLMMPYFVTQVFNGVHGRYMPDVNFVQHGVGEVPYLLRPLVRELDRSFPDLGDRTSILRIRYTDKRHASRFPHTDDASDYRYLVPFFGESELLTTDSETGELVEKIPLRPGSPVALNNQVPADAKLPHFSVPTTESQLLLVYGREAI